VQQTCTQTHRPCNISNNRPHLMLCTAMLSEPGFVRQLTTWHCPHSAATCCCCCSAAVPDHRSDSNQPISPAHQAHSSKPAAAVCGGWTGQTDRQTPSSYIDPARYTMLAVPKRLLTPVVGYRRVKRILSSLFLWQVASDFVINSNDFLLS